VVGVSLLEDLLAWALGFELKDPEPDRGRYAPPIRRDYEPWPGEQGGAGRAGDPWPYQPWPGDRR
jgi:hypothetical protein